MTDASGKLGHLDVSRREAAMGKEALQALTKLKVLVIGCRGAGIEAAKNVVLLGPKSVCVWDPNPAKIEDLGCNFYLDESDVKAGKSRAAACEPELVELNPFSKVTTRSDGFIDVLKDVVGKQYTIVIVTDLLCLTKKQLVDLSERCHATGIVFLMALASGVTATLFSDFGPNHVITDIDGVPTNVCAVGALDRVTLIKDDDKGWLKPETAHKEGRKAVIITVSCELKKELENGTSVSAHDWDTGTPIKLSDFKGGLAPLNDAKDVSATRVFRRVRSARTNPDGSVKKDKDGKVMYSTREFNQFHQFELNLEKATGKDGKPLCIPEAAWDEYESGGILTQLKTPQTVKFKSFVQSLQDPSHPLNERKRFDMTLMDTVPAGPQYCYGDGWDQGVGRQLHLEWAAVLDFEEKNGRYPRVHDDKDARELVKLAKAIADSVEFEGKKPFLDNGDLDEGRVATFSKLFQTELCGLSAFVGGVVAQEIVKKSGKYKPLTQWLHWDDLSLVPKSMTDNRPTIPSRYAHQISIFGQAWQNKVMQQKVFLVGAGALGCEYMKELALMGVGCGSGHVTVTDMDSIEASNLTRQFLFRAKHIDKQKSEVAAQVAKVMNPQFNVTAMTGENNDAKGMVAPSTEGTFTDEFWEDKDLVWNALDNVQARQYVDKKCLWHGKPLLESGTLSTQSNSEVFLPFKTMSYSDGVDEEPDAIAMCTVRNFPHLPLHCIEWAKVDFENTFVKSMEMYNQYVKDKKEFFKMIDQTEDPGDILQPVRSLVELQLKFAGKTITFEQCVEIAFGTFCAQFRHRILDLVHTFPEGHVGKSGKKFWSGHKRFPQVAEWALTNEMAVQYLFASANLYAFALKVKGIARKDYAKFKEFLEKSNLKAPSYTPNKVEVEEDEGDKKEGGGDDSGATAVTRTFLSDAPTDKLQEVEVTKFEKDDDENFHIDYMTHAANLRAWNYNIAASTRQTVRVTAGKILPALVTTTAMITGLQCLEFCKYIMGLQYLDQGAFRNWNINLGTSTFNSFDSSDPPAIRHGLPPYGNQRPSDLVHTEIKIIGNLKERKTVQHKAYPPGWTNWDHIVCDAGNLTGPQFADWMRNFLGYGLETEMVYSAGFSLWDSTQADDSLASRVPLANLFAHKRSSGAKKEGRAINRVKKIVQRLNNNPDSGVRLEAVGGNAYNLRAILSGPPKTPYAGGEFHISVKLPFEYPNKAPTVRFLTKIYHVNIDENGVPCPGQFALDTWTPSTTLEVLFNNICNKLEDPDDASPLYSPVGGAKHDTDVDAYNAEAAKWTKTYAAPGTAAPADDSAAETVTEDSLMDIDLKVIGRNYLVLETIQLDEKTGKPCGGFFRDPEGNVADLPRIKLVFSGAAAAAPKADVAVEETLESVEVEAGSYRDSLIAFAGASDSDNPIKDVTHVYKLEPQRAERYAKVSGMEALKPDGSNAVCLVGMDEYDEVAEMIVRLDDGGKPEEVCQAEDSIMMETTNLHGFPEFRFPGGEWRVATGATDAVVQWRDMKFKDYQATIKHCPPHCLAGLGRMLHLGPITKLYGSANDTMFPMSDKEKADWTVVPDDGGKKTFLPLQLAGLRSFNPVTRSYTAVGMRLGGAPPEDKEEEWFTGVVRHLKSNFQGVPASNQMLLDLNETDLLCARFMKAIEQCGKNKWTDLVFKTKGELKK